MASIIWIDLEGKRHRPISAFDSLFSFRSYIKQYKKKIREVELLDCEGLKSLCVKDTFCLEGLFQNCIYLVEVKEVIGTSDVKDMSRMFAWCISLESVPLFDTSNVEDMGGMFGCCENLEEVPCFNTSNVKNMTCMFHGCYSLKSVPLFDTSRVEYMGDMFKGCPSLDYINSVKNSKNPRISELYKCAWSKVG